MTSPKDYFKRLKKTVVDGREYRREIRGRIFIKCLSKEELRNKFQNKDLAFTEDYLFSVIRGFTCYDIYNHPVKEFHFHATIPEDETEEEELEEDYFSDEWIQVYDEDDYISEEEEDY